MRKGFLQTTTFLVFSILLFLGSNKTVAQSQPYLSNVLIVGNGLSNFPNILGNDHFGAAIADVGDLDGDGVHDIAVGAYSESITTGVTSGTVYIIYLKADGTVKNDITGKPKIVRNNIAGAINFGISIANIGDIDGDGVADIAVGANGDNYNGATTIKFAGDVYICFLKTNGTFKSSTKIVGNSLTNASATQSSPSGPQFGYRVALLGDYDGDGINDIIVGAPQDKSGSTTATGSVFLITLNKTGTVKKSYKIDTKFGSMPSGNIANGDNFGSAVCSLGDIDGDGVLDIAVGSAACGDGGKAKSGAVYLLNLESSTSAKPGNIKSGGVTKLSNAYTALSGVFPTNEQFGTSALLLKNFAFNKNSCRANGVRVLAVGAAGDNDYVTGAGACWLIYLDSATSSVLYYEKISGKNNAIKSYYPVGGGDAFGYAICNYQNMDTSTTQRLMLGAPNDSNGSGNPGVGEYYQIDLKKYALKVDTVLVAGTSDSVCANASAIVGVVFENLSNAPLFYLPAALKVSGAATFTLRDTFYASSATTGIGVCQKDTFWFKYKFPTNNSGAFNMKGYLILPGDFNPYDDTAKGVITVLPSLTQPSFGNDTVYLCSGSIVNLDLVNSGASYAWYKDGVLLPSATGETFAVNSQGNYIGVAKTGTCTISDTIQVYYIKSASVKLGPDQAVCFNDSTILDAGSLDAKHTWFDLAYPTFPLDTNRTFKVNDNTTRSYIGSVSYSDHGTTCTYADTINITFTHVTVNLGRDTVMCDGQKYVLDASNAGSTYTWYKDGVQQAVSTQTDTLTQSGTYAVKVQTGNCYGYDTMKITFMNVPSVNFTPKFDTLCKSETILLDAGNPAFKHTWYKNGTDLSLNDTTTQYTVSSQGQYKVLIENRKRASCNATDAVTVTYNILSVSLKLPKVWNLCQGDVKTITANVSTTVANPAFYHWFKDGNPSGTSSTQTISTPGKYWVVVQVGHCFASDSVTVVYTPITQPDFGNSDTLLCKSTTITLDAGNNNGSTFKWLTPRGTKTTQQVTVDTAGTYHVFVTNGPNGLCKRDTFIRVKYIIIQVDLGKDTTLCFGRPLTLDAKNNQNAATYQWYADGNPIGGANSQKYSPTQAATYKVIVTQKYCSDSGKVFVNFLPSPTVYKLDTTICWDDTIVLNAGNPGSRYLWSYQGLRTQTVKIHRELSPTKVRTYKAYVTNGGCTDTSVFHVSYYDKVQFLNWAQNVYMCDTMKEGVWLDAGAATTYDWEPTGDKTRFLKITSPGKYKIRITNAGGCSAFDSVHVFECPPTDVYIPNVFTPDLKSDGLNDTFRIYNLNSTEYQLTIYNRWGEQVFQSSDVNKGWDGKYHGDPVPEGIYNWTLIYRLHTSTGTPPRKIMSGNLTLIRH
jgi:gliding motility-associated-like protein